MANSATGNAANSAKNLLNQAQGFAGPTSGLYTGFQGSLGTAQGNQANQLSGALSGISNLQNISKTGGYDSNQLNTLNQQTAGLTASGGYNPSQLRQIEGGYSQLAQNGGYTPQQAQQFVQQATEGTTATGQALEDQAKRNAVATGGLGTGGAQTQLSRQLGQAQGQNTLNAQVALNQSQTANKLAGLGGEGSLASQQAGNRLAAQDQQLGLASDVAGNTLQGNEAANQNLSQLYNTTTGQVTQLGNQLLQALGLDFNTQEQAGDLLAKISQNPSMFQSIIGTVGGAVGGAAGAIAGI